jgi:hypothetical protein
MASTRSLRAARAACAAAALALAVAVAVALLLVQPAVAADVSQRPPETLVTGNGFGFAVLRADTGALTKFYAHPYAYERADPAQPLSEGLPTTQFIDALWHGGAASTGGAAAMRAHYAQQTQVMQWASASGGGTTWMPFGLAQAALIVQWRGTGNWRVRWSHPVSARETVGPEGAVVLHFADVPEALLLVPLDAVAGSEANGADGDLAGHAAWAIVSLEPGNSPAAALAVLKQWRGALSPQALLERELADFEHWRVPMPATVREPAARQVWRQGEAVLRMGQSREPNTAMRHGNGLIVASLPGGEWFTPWVRDMAWATVALARMGHRAEARAALLAFFNAQPTGAMHVQVGSDYQVSVVRYFGDGAEEPFFTQEGSTNIELDNWGLVLWALGEYLRRGPDAALLASATPRGTLYESARDFVMRPLLAVTEPVEGGRIVRADTSIWEEHEVDRKHFAWTTATAVAGLESFVLAAQQQGDAKAVGEVLQAMGPLQRGFNAAFVRDGQLRGTMEPGIKNDIDGALPALFEFGVARDRGLLGGVVERMAALKVASGGYRRVRGTYTDPKIFEYWYEQQEFVFVDVALARALRYLGRNAEADAMLRHVIEGAAAHDGLVPEMLVSVPCELFPGAIGDPTGANPMVGYGAGAVVMALLP